MIDAMTKPEPPAGLPVPSTRLLAAQVADIRRRQMAYLEAAEPITRARVKLRLFATTTTMTIPGGEMRETLPPEIQAIDDKYAELLKVLQRHFLGTANDMLSVSREREKRND